MKIPHTICINTLKTYTRREEQLEKKKKLIRADDFVEWDSKLPKHLSVICIEAISQNWKECGHPVDLGLCSDTCHLLDILPTTVPLEISVLKINEDIYWKRAYMARWPKSPPSSKSYSDVPEYRQNSNIFSSLSSIYSTSTVTDMSRRSSRVVWGGERFDVKTWKENYLERHLQEALESLQPECYDPEKMKQLSTLCRNYVTVLNLKQLKASKNAETKDHIPLNAILVSLSRLRDFSLCFKQTYVGEDFSWHIFKTSPNDIKLLAQGISKCNLTTLRIQNSDIDCSKTVSLMRALERNDTLRVLDFSHCKIADHGVLAICKVIHDHPTIDNLILVNNNIGPKGAEVLAYTIKQPSCKLKMLNLRLNQLENEGGQFLINACVREALFLKSLYLSACGLDNNILHLGRMLAFNNTLEVLDLSNNRLGEVAGLDIFKGMEYNKSLISIDVRMCGISQDLEQKIRTFIHENRRYIRLNFNEKGIVKLQKVVKFKEFQELEEKEREKSENVVRSSRDVHGEMMAVFSTRLDL